MSGGPLLAIDPMFLLDGERMMLRAVAAGWDGDHFKLDEHLRVSVLSLSRFDLIDSEWRHGQYHWHLTGLGTEIAEQFKTRYATPCCPKAARLNCVCTEKHGCVEHGPRCHGSHD